MISLILASHTEGSSTSTGLEFEVAKQDGNTGKYLPAVATTFEVRIRNVFVAWRDVAMERFQLRPLLSYDDQTLDVW